MHFPGAEENQDNPSVRTAELRYLPNTNKYYQSIDSNVQWRYFRAFRQASIQTSSPLPIRRRGIFRALSHATVKQPEEKHTQFAITHVCLILVEQT